MKYEFLDIIVIGSTFAAILLGVQMLTQSQPPKTWVDNVTGCEFLISGNGSITPRIDADGIHMGCKGLQGDRK